MSTDNKCSCNCHYLLNETVCKDCCVRELFDHKQYQIDENRKISRRMDELEKFHQDWKEMPKWDLHPLYEKVNELEEWKVIAIEKNIQDVERIRKLESEFERKLDVDFKKWEEYFATINIDKKPYKCPVCNGKYIALFKECECACLACDKGIVWG